MRVVGRVVDVMGGGLMGDMVGCGGGGGVMQRYARRIPSASFDLCEYGGGYGVLFFLIFLGDGTAS